ncbi:MAG: hypothetical protein PF570_10265 [Candidatus Cloacimonetes bacterium]|jgi:hypothetical protein|nr:hypothetical protein [Candidatus Cloacimonadota bacterium]
MHKDLDIWKLGIELVEKIYKYISFGSFSELETQLIISEKLGYFKDNSIFEDIENIRRKHLNFIKYIKNNPLKHFYAFAFIHLWRK